MKISISEILWLTLIGLLAQSFLVAGNLHENGFYNRYLGFSILLPLYAVFMTFIISYFNLQRKTVILPLSMFFLAIVGFINITLYPIMGGSTGQMYGIIFIYGVLPATLIFGALYGWYLSYKLNKNTISTSHQSKHFNKQGIIIWIVGLSVITLSIFTYPQYNNLFIPLVGLVIGIGMIMRIKWIRWILLIALYILILQPFAFLIADFEKFHYIDNYPFLALVANLFLVSIVISLLSNKESFKQFNLDYANKQKEMIVTGIIAIFVVVAFNLIGVG